MILLSENIDENLARQLSNNQLFLNSSLWEEMGMRHVCPSIIEWNIEEIWLGKNDNPQIVREIYHIKFPNLKQISLNGNEINSIEMLGRIRLPALVKIILGHNKINKLKTLAKANWPKIKDIHVFNNNILDVPVIANLKAEELEWITVEYAPTDNSQSADLGWICKLQSKKMKALRLKSQFRIQQSQMTKVIKQRYSDISLKYHNSV